MRKYLIAALAALTLASAFVVPAKAGNCYQNCTPNGVGGYTCTTTCW